MKETRLRRSWTYFVVFVAFWSSVILFDAVRDVIEIQVRDLRGRPAEWLVQEWLMFWGSWVLVSSPLPLLVARFTPAGLGPGRWVALHLVGSIAATAVHLALAAAAFSAALGGNNFGGWLLDFALDLSFRDLVIYWALLGSLLAWHYHLRAQERELDAARLAARAGRLEAAAQAARLDALRRELQPHFLFNALHSVGALIRREERSKALDALERLGELLRSGFDPDAPDWTPLSEELHRLRQYLGLQEIRFGERLRISWHVEEAALSHPVPALILQPLVENAVKHGMEGSSSPVSISIEARVDGASLLLSVTDDGPGLNEAAVQGVGLSNTRNRIDLLYGEDGSVEVSQRAEGGTSARITVPVRSWSLDGMNGALARG